VPEYGHGSIEARESEENQKQFQPPMNADKRRWKRVLSAFIGVYRRLGLLLLLVGSHRAIDLSGHA
jgi:hypothetical protein